MEDPAGTVSASKCRACARTWWPERSRCPACARPTEAARIPAEGTVRSWTIVHQPAAGAPAGAVVTVVDLDGALALATAATADGLRVGARATLVEREGRLRVVALR